MFKEWEAAAAGTALTLSQVLDGVRFNSDGLVPAVAQQFDSGEVLMLAWMNREAIIETLQTGQVCYWSRSRQAYWRKGESSGHRQLLRELRLDCDGDAVLLLVDQHGPACHTDRRNCFYIALDEQGARILTDPASGL